MSHTLEVLGVIAAVSLAAGAIVATSTRARAALALAALALAPVLLAADIWDSPQLRSLRDRPAVALAAVVLGLIAVAVLAVAFRRRPLLFPLFAVAALPFRIPISAGGDTAGLLVPLYLVVAAGVLAYAIPRLRAADDDAPFPPRALEWALAAALVLYGLQSAWTSDFDKALQQVGFFYVPFALLYLLLREVDWRGDLVRRALGVLVVLALIFAAVGFVEFAREELFINPDSIAESQIVDYFRVQSLFFDPNIYGRFVAVAMLAIVTWALWRRRERDVWIAGGVLAVLWAGLLLTFSQSSFAALLAGLAVLAALRWSARRTAIVAAALLTAAIAFVVIAPGAIKLELGSSKSADRATSGRLDLMEGGVELFADAPLVGHGSGAFSKEYRRAEGVSSERAASASHTIPLTVAAEQGIIGLGVYLVLLIAALSRLLRGAAANPARAFVAAAFIGLVVHTMLYAAFLEDPLTWTLLGVGTALAAAAAARETAAMRAAKRHPELAAAEPLG